jgi:thioesterase domain-containing protein
MARQLVDLGEEVAQLIILDTGIPSKRDLSRVGGWDDSRWLVNVAQTIGQMYNKQLELPIEEIQCLSWGDQVGKLAQEMIKHKIIAATDDYSLVRGIVEVFKTQAQISFEPAIDKKFAISLLRANEIMTDFLEGMPEELRSDPGWGWGQYALGDLRVEFVDGNHLTMMTKPHAIKLADLICSSLPHNS